MDADQVLAPNKRVRADAAPRPVSGRNWLCDILRIEGHFGKLAARLTRRALGTKERMVLWLAAAWGLGCLQHLFILPRALHVSGMSQDGFLLQAIPT